MGDYIARKESRNWKDTGVRTRIARTVVEVAVVFVRLLTATLVRALSHQKDMSSSSSARLDPKLPLRDHYK